MTWTFRTAFPLIPSTPASDALGRGAAVRSHDIDEPGEQLGSRVHLSCDKRPNGRGGGSEAKATTGEAGTNSSQPWSLPKRIDQPSRLHGGTHPRGSLRL